VKSKPLELYELAGKKPDLVALQHTIPRLILDSTLIYQQRSKERK
jgi:hypothetical protein